MLKMLLIENTNGFGGNRQNETEEKINKSISNFLKRNIGYEFLSIQYCGELNADCIITFIKR